MTGSAATFKISALDDTKKAFKSVASGLKDLSVNAAKTAAGVAAVTATAAIGLAVSAARNAKEMTAYANSIGMSTEQLSAWGYASNTVAVSQEKLNDVFRDTADKIGDAFVSGGGAALDVLERLNLNAADMVKLSPDQQLLKIAEGLDEVGTKSEKVFLLESLASDASMLLPLLDNNAEKLKTLKDEAIASGAALSDVDAAQIQQANEAWDKSAAIIQGVGSKIAVEFSPYISALAEYFKDAAIESGGFGEEVKSAMSGIITSVAFVLDVFRGLEVVIIGLELLFEGFAAGYFSALEQLQYMVLSIVNLIPGINIKPIELLSAITKEANKDFTETKKALSDLVAQPMPSENAKKYLSDVKEAATEAAEKVAAVTKTKEPAIDGTESAGLIKAREEAQKKFNVLEQSMLSEEERMVLAYESQQLIVENAFQTKLIDEVRQNLILDDLELNHQIKLDELEDSKLLKAQEDTDKKLAIQMDYYDRLYNLEAGSQQAALKFSNAMRKNDLKGALQNGAAMLGNAAKHNKAAFEVQKAFSLANAIVTLPSAVMKSFDAGGGFPWGLVPAGLMLAQGMQQISAIKSTSFGGGGSVSSISGGGSTSPSAPVASGLPPGTTALPGREEQKEAAAPKNISITIEGNPSPQQIRGTIDAINEQVDDGYYINARIVP